MSRHPPFQLKHFRRMTQAEWGEILETLPNGASKAVSAKMRAEIDRAVEAFFDHHQEALLHKSTSPSAYRKIERNCAALVDTLRVELFSTVPEFELCTRISNDLRRLDLLCRQKRKDLDPKRMPDWDWDGLLERLASVWRSAGGAIRESGPFDRFLKKATRRLFQREATALQARGWVRKLKHRSQRVDEKNGGVRVEFGAAAAS